MQEFCSTCGNKILKPKSNKRFCGRSCRDKEFRLRHQNPNKTYFLWTQEENEYLSDIAYYTHHKDLAKRLNAFNRANGNPARRTGTAILQQCELMGIKVSERVDNISPVALAKRLKISKGRIQSWVRKGWLPAKKKGSKSPKGRWTITLNDLWNLLYESPSLAIGMDLDELKLCFMERKNPSVDDLIQRIHKAIEQKKIEGGHRLIKYRVYCIDNDTWYSSLHEAGVKTGCDVQVFKKLAKAALKRSEQRFECQGVQFYLPDDSARLTA